MLIPLSITLHSQTGEREKAISFYQSGKYAEALKLFEKDIETGNAPGDVYSASVDCALQLKNYKKAAVLITKTLEKFGADYELELLLHRINTQTGNLSAAVSGLRAMMKSYPDSGEVKTLLSDVYLTQGVQYFNSKRMPDASVSFKNSLIYNRKNQDARRNLIVVLIQMKQFQEALPVAKEGFDLFPREKIFAQMYIECLLAVENYTEALKVGEKIAAALPGDKDLQLNLAILYRYNQNSEKALTIYSALRKKYPKDKSAFKSEIEYWQLYAMHDTIITRYMEYLSVVPDDEEMILGLGKQYERKKEFAAAREVYRQLLKKDISREAAILIAACYTAEGKSDSAIVQLNEYIVTGGKDPDAYLELTDLLLGSGRKTEAKQVMLTGLSRNPEEVKFDIQLARIYFFDGVNDSAFSCLDKVKTSYTDYPEISFLLANIYIAWKDTAKAIFQFNRTIKSALNQSQILQGEITRSFSGQNLIIADSLNETRNNAVRLDSVTTILKQSFLLLREISSEIKYTSLLNTLIADMPQSAVLYLKRAQFFSEINSLALAESDFELALNMAPSSEEVQFEAGLFYEKTENYPKAFAAFSNALALNKNKSIYYRKVIDTAEKSERLPDVCEYWLRLYPVNKTNAVLMEYLIEALHKSGRYDEATELINAPQE